MFTAKKINYVFVISMVLYFASLALGVEILDPRYSVSTYASFTLPGTYTRDLVFDSSDNLYVVVGHSSGGAVYKITPDGTVSPFVTGLSNPQDIAYGGGTDFGDKLYVANHDGKNIISIDMDGNKSTFCSFTESPLSVMVDSGSVYDGQMYVGTDSPYSIWRVSHTGSGCTISNVDKACIDMVMDPGTRYGGKMYLSMTTGSPNWIPSILKMETNGDTSVFLSDVGGGLEFDTTLYESFGGDLYACTPSRLRRISPDGTYVDILTRSTGLDLGATLTFGNDGAMYFMEIDSTANMAYVRQVTPEPMTLSLLAMGGLAVLKRRRIKG